MQMLLYLVLNSGHHNLALVGFKAGATLLLDTAGVLILSSDNSLNFQAGI